MKNIRDFLSKTYHFWMAKCSVYLNRLVYVMHMQTAKTQISLCIGAGPSLSANQIIEHYRLYQWRANAQMRFCACAGRI